MRVHDANHLAKVLSPGVLLRRDPELFRRVGGRVLALHILVQSPNSHDEPAALARVFCRCVRLNGGEYLFAHVSS
jgi:hypothetical protein